MPRYCDKGRLLLSAVADIEKHKQMVMTMKEGLKMEVLSYKITLEEPKGCGIISCALNKGHEAVLRTTELTALKCLAGEVTSQSEKKHGADGVV